MKRRQALRLGVTSAAFALVEWGVGCGNGAATGGTGGSGGTSPDDLSDVIYEGGATDEALRALLAESPNPSDTQAASLITPSPGSSVSAAAMPTFVWAVGAKTALRPKPDHDLRVAGLSLHLGPREAIAHGTPISGRAYFVVFAAKNADRLVRLFTTSLEYMPTSDLWTRLATAHDLSVTITNAIFEENRVAIDGGPFRGPTTIVIVGP